MSDKALGSCSTDELAAKVGEWFVDPADLSNEELGNYIRGRIFDAKRTAPGSTGFPNACLKELLRRLEEAEAQRES